MDIRTAAVSDQRRSAILVILLCFFASGMSGLIYQVVWVRELVLVFGATTFAVSTVLTAFMGGLALGSFYSGRRSKVISRPLRLYGLLEIGIGLYGLAVPVIFSILPDVYRALWHWMPESFFSLSVVRFVFAASILIIPTSMMGATLPVLSSYYARDVSRVGLRAGALYSINTFGAVIGAAATGFILIPALGMKATTTTAAGINIALGLITLSISRLLESPPVSQSIEVPPSGGRTVYRLLKSALPTYKEFSTRLLSRLSRAFARLRPSRLRTRDNSDVGTKVAAGVDSFDRRAATAVLICFGFSGFIALSYEVIWSRVLSLILGSSVYAFSIMLTTFLVGLALGSFIAARFVDRIRSPIFVFAVLEIGVGVSSLIGAYLFNELPYVFVQTYRWFDEWAFGVLMVARFMVASLIMILPTLLLGALFPLVVRIISGSLSNQGAGQTVGDAYAANTLGAIAGSFASGFVLIPSLGLMGSIKLCAAVNFALGGAMFIVSWRHRSRMPGKSKKRGRQEQPLARLRLSTAAGTVASALLIVLITVSNPPWDADVMSSAVYRYAPSLAEMSRQDFVEYLKRGQGETIFYEEGITATVAVQELNDGRVLKVNGKPEASTTGDMPTQVLIGTLPLLVREKTDDVLLIGLGSGVTLGSIQQFPVKRVTCVELEPAVISASRHFDEVNNRPLDDPRLRMINNDGRNFIYTTEEQFDVIVSEPSNPWLTGVANLFTLEYFKRGADRLKPDGVFSQWLQIYEMTPDELKVLVATFRTAFPHVYIFRGSEGDLMLLGSKRERQLSLRIVDSHLSSPQVKADHKRVNVNTAADLISRFYLGPEEVPVFADGAPLNTDDNALIEFSAPRRVGSPELTGDLNLKELLAHAGSPLPYLYEAGFASRGEIQFLLEAALGALKRTDPDRAEQFANYSLGIYPTARGHSLIGEIHYSRGNEKAAVAAWESALALEPNHFFTLVNLGKYYLTGQEIGQAEPYLERAVKLDPSSARARHLRGLAYQARGENMRASLEYREALPDAAYTRSIPTFYLNFGTALISIGLYPEAAQMLEEYVELSPNDADGHFQLGVAYQVQAERSIDEKLSLTAVTALKKTLALQPNHAMAHYYLGKAYRSLERFEDADAAFESYQRLTP